MAKLRMFANLREIAGTGRAAFDGDTVGGVIAAAAERYGEDFASGVSVSRIWVNGEEATAERPVGPEDEVVLLPPVSGGSQPATVGQVDPLAFVPVMIAVIVVLANTSGGGVWAAGLVTVLSAWALDLGSVFTARGRRFAMLAVVSSGAVGAIAAHVLGGSGYTLALATAIAVALGWAVAFPEYREVETFAPTALAATLAALAAASMVLAHSPSSPDPSLVGVFLAAVISGVLFGSIVARMPAIPYLDPISVTAIVAVVGAVASAALFDADVVGYLLVGIGLAVALVAGRGLSSMMRRGAVRLAERSPGVMPTLDGAVLAAAIVYPLAVFVL